MKQAARKASKRRGVLSFEWMLLITLLTIGLVSGLGAVRDALIDELGDVAEASINIDQSYSFPGVPLLGIPGSEFEDTIPAFSDCSRSSAPIGQTGSFSDAE